MSDVDVLRRAAALMRERAEKASPGPWAHGHEGLQGGEVIRGGESRVARVYKNGWPEYLPDCENAEHIASWHPGVAVPIAELLEFVIEGRVAIHGINVIAEQRGREPQGPGSALFLDLEQHALRIARAYLGESA